MSFLVWACVHVWRRKARVNGSPPRGKIEVWPGGDSGTATGETLREAGRLDSLQLLHFHLGSQMANIRDIATGVRESARFYVELHKLGVNIQCFDVGGGLGVDYEGTRSQSDCSVNYGLNEYANNIIWAIGDACEENGLPHPTVITESGRAVTAHHTVLVSNIIGVERNEYTVPTAPAEDAPRALQACGNLAGEHEPGTRRSLREWLHDSQMDLHDIHIGYSSGTFSLQERAWAEQLYLSMCHEVQKQLDPQNRAHRPIIDELQERMADKMYVNFSLFQSMPDAWGIDQLFPVLPLEGLDQVPERRAVLLDITLTQTVLSTTILMVTVLPRQCLCRSTSGESADARFLYGWRISGDPRQHAQPVRDTEAVDVFVFPDGSVRSGTV
ncbi:arginine decarboxylase [Escherichia coli]|uniref:Arginine decarboxylase n=1 Tax=Escherichia coli TaxID=562 RepID=A0A377D7E9_ECOLX|nr:arginine decarboxylase [Escherichia coli]